MVAPCLWEANNSTRRNRPAGTGPSVPPVLPAVVNDLAAFAVLTVFAVIWQGRFATIITATRRLTISPRWRRPTAVGTTTGNETRQTADQAPCPSGVAGSEERTRTPTNRARTCRAANYTTPEGTPIGTRRASPRGCAKIYL